MDHRKHTSDRIVLDVGGREFATSISTLTFNSAYFATQFSDDWYDNQNDDITGTRHYFLDQDPDAFAIILKFMRDQVIKVQSLTASVLLLIEYLGIEALIRSVKIKAYCNMHPMFVGTEEHAEKSFDEKYGCIREAILQGDLPKYLVDSVDKGIDYAVLQYTGLGGFKNDSWLLKLTSQRLILFNTPMLSVLNRLYSEGYRIDNRDTALYKKPRDGCKLGDSVAFFRKRELSGNSRHPSTALLIDERQIKNTKKTFALCVTRPNDDGGTTIKIYYQNVAEIYADENDEPRPAMRICEVQNKLSWLHDFRFNQREFELEHLCRHAVQDNFYWRYPPEDCSFQIYSRPFDSSE